MAESQISGESEAGSSARGAAAAASSGGGAGGGGGGVGRGGASGGSGTVRLNQNGACPVRACSLRFGSVRELSCHLRAAHLAAALVCPVVPCTFTTDDDDELRSHIVLEHSGRRFAALLAAADNALPHAGAAAVTPATAPATIAAPKCPAPLVPPGESRRTQCGVTGHCGWHMPWVWRGRLASDTAAVAESWRRLCFYYAKFMA